MVDWHKPELIAAEIFAFVKLLHVIAGLYLWEYFANLDYEWEFISRKRPYRWTIWLYSVTRLCALMNVILGLIGFNVKHPLDCELWLIFEFIFAYIAFALASLLIVARLLAIWNRYLPVSILAICIWLGNVAFLIRSTVTANAKWDDQSKACTIVDSRDSRVNVTVTLGADLALLIITIIGLRKQRDYALGRMLFNQGLIWIIMATVAQVPPAVFLWLNLNDAMNIMFQTPSLTIMTIAATRMYRSLSNFGKAESVRYQSPQDFTLSIRTPTSRTLDVAGMYATTDACDTVAVGASGIEMEVDPKDTEEKMEV